MLAGYGAPGNPLSATEAEPYAETLRVLGRYASNPELSFTWYDAAVLSQKIRQESHKATPAGPHKPQRRFDVPLPTDRDEV